MLVLKTSVAAASPMLLPNCGLIAKKLILQRKFTSFAAVSLLTSHNRGFNSQYNKGLTFPTAIACRALNQRHIGYREYVTKKTEPIQTTPAATPPNLPQKDMEKVCFRVIAFIWDCGYYIITWLRKLMSHVVEDPTVQQYWKRFHEKMAESKKSD